MYCNFCGGKIDRASMKCVSCGKPAGRLSGGNGFRDMLDGRSAPAPAQEPAAPKQDRGAELLIPRLNQISAEIRELRENAPKQSKLPALLAALCILVAAASLLTGLIAIRKIDKLDSSFDTKMGQLQNSVRNAEEREELTPAPAEPAQSTPEPTPAETPEPAPTPTPEPEATPDGEDESAGIISIEKDPTDETDKRTGRSVYFTCKVRSPEDAEPEFTWEYKDENGEWSPLPEEPAYKVDLEKEVDEDGEVIWTSTLEIKAVTKAQEGEYRCRIEDGSGNSLLSEAAKLTVK